MGEPHPRVADMKGSMAGQSGDLDLVPLPPLLVLLRDGDVEHPVLHLCLDGAGVDLPWGGSEGGGSAFPAKASSASMGPTPRTLVGRAKLRWKRP